MKVHLPGADWVTLSGECWDTANFHIRYLHDVRWIPSRTPVDLRRRACPAGQRTNVSPRTDPYTSRRPFFSHRLNGAADLTALNMRRAPWNLKGGQLTELRMDMSDELLEDRS